MLGIYPRIGIPVHNCIPRETDIRYVLKVKCFEPKLQYNLLFRKNIDFIKCC